MTGSENQSPVQAMRVLIIGLVAVIIVLGLALILLAMGGRPGQPQAPGERVNALENSTNECAACHARNTPGIVQQYGYSSMAAAEVLCEDCHVVPQDYAGAVEHEGTYVLPSPTSAMCARCHSVEVSQFNQSRHGLPAYIAYAGTEPLDETLLAQYESIPEGQFAPDKMRATLHALEGEAVTRFACETCHNVGKPAADGSVGQCQKCHLRHEYSLEQARKPETCNQCHIGPDHPQWEIYFESPHGIAYSTMGDDWNWLADPGTLDVTDFPAPTCATCHFSGFGGASTTHDAGDRLTWYLFSPISERRPTYQDNAVRMQTVCQECHNTEFIQTFYTDADKAVEQVNAWVKESDAIMAELKEKGLVTTDPFDQPIDFTYYELWHHWGRTTKFGTWMQGPDYTQWHGAYEVLSDLAELREMARELLEAAGQ